MRLLTPAATRPLACSRCYRVLLVLLCLLFMHGCANRQYPLSMAIPPQADAPLVTTVENIGRDHPGQSGFRLLQDNHDAFNARIELIRSAQYSLDLQYYILHDGLTARILMNELLKAADRGVRIRLLIDDTSSDNLDSEFTQLMAHPNIEIRVFNPLHIGRSTGITRNLGRLLNLSQQHRRMHNKLWLTDSAVAIVGGRNIGDEYFDSKPSLTFTDIDLLCAGDIARDLGRSFDQYWNHPLSQPLQQFLWRTPTTKRLNSMRKRLERQIVRAKNDRRHRNDALFRFEKEPQMDDWLHRLIWARASALWDSPEKVLSRGIPDEKLLLSHRLMPEINAVKSKLILISAYFVPTAAGVDYLTQKADRGVSIQMFTNSLEATDVPIVHGGYAPYRQEMLEHGIHIFELHRHPALDQKQRRHLFPSAPASLHSKALVIDGDKTFIGSLNLDPRSILWNTEVGVLVYSKKLGDLMAELSRQAKAPNVSYEVRLIRMEGRNRLVWVTEEKGNTRILTREPGSLWRHLNAWFARSIGLEKML